MIKSFTVGNFKAFRDPQTINIKLTFGLDGDLDQQGRKFLAAIFPENQNSYGADDR